MKKTKELWNLTKEELEAKLREAKERLFHLRFVQKGTGIKNPLEIRTLRRSIARMITILKLRGIEEKKR